MRTVDDQNGDLVDECFNEAISVLRRSSGRAGFLASASDDHYASVWTRDAAFTSIGCDSLEDEDLLDTTRRGLISIGERHSALGQIPDAFWPADDFWDWGEAGATDATSLYIIAAANYLRHRQDPAIERSVREIASKAHVWLTYQDANNFELIDSPEAGDWMDSTLNRSGKVLYNNVLYQWATRDMASLIPERSEHYLSRANSIKQKINLLFWPTDVANYARLLDHVPYPQTSKRQFPHVASLQAYAAASTPDRSHYVSHVQFGRFADVCDTLANVLAILTGIADLERAKLILTHLLRSEAMTPFPVRSWMTATRSNDDPWLLHKGSGDRFQDERWRNGPYHYHNAAVWPFIGGYFIAALAKVGMMTEAQNELARLALANRAGNPDEAWGFHEWLDGRSGTPCGASNQCWNAGAFVLAYNSVYQGSQFD